MPSEVQIANAALLKLGESPITSFSGTGKGAELANNTFAIHRDALLRAHEWGFAIYRDALAADAASPSWEFTYSYPLPGEPHYCLRVLTIENPSDYDWRVEGRAILTDLGAPLYLKYIQRVSAPGSWDTLFVEALVIKLAYEWCESLTADNDLRAGLLRELVGKLGEASAVTGKEGKTEPIPDGTWLEAHV